MCVITHDHDVATRAHRQVRIVDGRLTEVESVQPAGEAQ
jgi:predicted ABC-type transport system involved in lysophospholipase L1 biosynthesis ATPase subunit